jgi:hypothetical protein
LVEAIRLFLKSSLMVSTKGESEIPGVLEREVCRKMKGDEAMSTKSQVVSWMGVSLGLVQGLLEEVQQLGGGDEDIRKLVKPEGRVLLAKFAQMVVGVVCQTFKVMIDYSRDLSQMVAAGNYNWANSDITADHFPVNGVGRQEREVTLFHFNHDISSDDVIKEMGSAGYRPATIEELLAFGELHPELQRQFPIIAIGSVWVDSDGYRCVPGLWSDSDGRRLDVNDFDGWWGHDCRFLAVCK